jgi:hypothetical protein
MKTFDIYDTPEGLRPVKKKPVVVHAMQVNEPFTINTLEGQFKLAAGAYLIKGVRGELYGCEQSIFEETYDFLDDDDEMNEDYDYRIATRDKSLLTVTQPDDNVIVVRRDSNTVNLCKTEALSLMRVLERMLDDETVTVNRYVEDEELKYQIRYAGRNLPVGY